MPRGSPTGSDDDESSRRWSAREASLAQSTESATGLRTYSVAFLAKLWFFDRMVWRFETRRGDEPVREWV
jgi:hypothetical protein